MEIRDWLLQLDLEQYVEAFAENAVDWSVLPTLTADDLREIGVAAVGHRRKLLNAIAALAPPAPTQIAAAPVSAIAGSWAGAERRQLSIMFCDLVGSTSLAVRFDPEDLRELIGAYHGAVEQEVQRFRGFVAKYMGDGALIYFGYPQAQEDDRARRAGWAGARRADRQYEDGGVPCGSDRHRHRARRRRRPDWQRRRAGARRCR
jgi:class 3 adenylate cyclase